MLMNAKQTFHSVKLGFTRCYLVKTLDGYLLIDTSDTTYFRSFQKKAAKLGIDLAEIKYVLLTHHHDDHAGFAAELVKKTKCRVVVHRDAVAPLTQGKAEYEGAKVLNRRVYATMLLYSWYYFLVYGKTFPALTLTDRDIVVEGDNETFLKKIGVDGVVLHTPGHSRDSISVLLSDGTAFVGDAAMNLLWWTGSRHRPVGFDDINTVYESWQKLRERGARVIYPAHGKPFSVEELLPSPVTTPLKW
jgi:glyoxylase-like metal-dependent hydrolase (beta-lactamase superfamily II)